MTEKNNEVAGNTPEETQLQKDLAAAFQKAPAPTGESAVLIDAASAAHTPTASGPTEPAAASATPYGVADTAAQTAAVAPTNPYAVADAAEQTAAPAPAPWEYAQETPQNPYGQAQQTAQQPVTYGTPPQQYAFQGNMPPAYVAAPTAPGSGKAMAALLCGIGAIVFSGTILIGIVLGVIAIILAGQYIKSFGKEGKANAGKITGIIGIVLSVLMLIFWIVFFVMLVSVVEESTSYYDSTYSYSDSSSSDSGSGSGSGSDSESPRSDSGSGSSSDSGSGALSVYGDPADVESLTAAAEATMASLQSPDEATLKEISEGIDEYFYEITDERLSDFGVDPMELAKKMTSSMTYEFTSISAYTDDGSVMGNVESITMTDFFEAYYAAIEKNSSYTSDTQAEAMKEAVQTMVSSEEPFYIDYVRSGGGWEVEESEYNNPTLGVFGIYLF